MSISLQKGNFWKRISAYLFDLILTVMIAVGIAAAMSAILKYDNYSKELETYYTHYETIFSTDFDMTEEEYNALSEDAKANYQAASEAFGKDQNVKAVYAKMFSLTLVIASVGLLVAISLIYFVVPLLFKNGQTLGKKIFGLAVVRSNCVKITPPILFVRSILGLYTIETMVPVLLVTMIYFGVMGIVGTMTIFLILGLQVVVMAVTQTNSSIHDLLSDTVVVDMSSQEIFENQEELIAYKEALQAQEAAKTEQQYVPSTFLQSVQAMQAEKFENEDDSETNDNNG